MQTTQVEAWRKASHSVPILPPHAHTQVCICLSCPSLLSCCHHCPPSPPPPAWWHRSKESNSQEMFFLHFLKQPLRVAFFILFVFSSVAVLMSMYWAMASCPFPPASSAYKMAFPRSEVTPPLRSHECFRSQRPASLQSCI